LTVAAIGIGLFGCMSTPKSGAVRLEAPVAADATGTEVYQLANGLKVYLSRNPEEPSIQTRIVIRAGSLQDPADKTGLAHYLEHLMFKGSDHFGTVDYATEKPQIARIYALYNQYCAETDEAKRAAIYQEIDRVSGEAARYAVANEYDRMMSDMGGSGINAYTSFDRTVYLNSIPANCLDKWLDMEADRFAKPVFRLFHTELEAVYEESNMYADMPDSRMQDLFLGTLFPNHPLGRPVIGLKSHLRNPAPDRVMEFFQTWYVPNNMAICLSGDFDRDQVLAAISRTFGKFPAKPLPLQACPPAAPLAGTATASLVAPGNEEVALAWRLNQPSVADKDLFALCAMLLSNQQAGLFDRDLVQTRKVASIAAMTEDLVMHASLFVSARPNQKDPVESLLPLIDGEIAKLKAGDYPDWLIEAVINNLRLSRTLAQRSNETRAEEMTSAFTSRIPWATVAGQIDRMAKYTKADVSAFAKEHLTADRVVVYRKKGELVPGEKIKKPTISPVQLNRGQESAFCRDFCARPVAELKPKFIDFKKDVDTRCLPGRAIAVSSIRNTQDGLFEMRYVFELGTDNDPWLDPAVKYADVIGTSTRQLEELKTELFRLGGDYSLSCDRRQVVMTVSGLQKNFRPIVTLAEDLLDHPKADAAALKTLVGNIIKDRDGAKSEVKEILLKALASRVKYGIASPYTNVPTGAELAAVSPETLTGRLASLKTHPHHILYFGPLAAKELGQELATLHQTGTPVPAPAAKPFPELPTTSDSVIFINYPGMSQVNLLMTSRRAKFSPDTVAARALFSEYYGDSMNSITFQTIRESKALAYSCSCRYSLPEYPEGYHFLNAFMSTQADKFPEAVAAMRELIQDCPISKPLLGSCKIAAVRKIAADHLSGMDILELMEKNRLMGLSTDVRKTVYGQMGTMGEADLLSFHKEHLKDAKFTLMVVGDKTVVNMDDLKKFGPVTELTVDEVFPK
jgi:predicted Zn-dependent peptidase